MTAAEAVLTEPFDESSSRSWGEADDDDVAQLPIIRLADSDEEMIGTAVGDETGDEMIIVGTEQLISLPVAIPLVTSLRDDSEEVYEDRTRNLLDHYYSDDVRAEFISVTFYKERQDYPLGINLLQDIRIYSITEGSMAEESPLRPGDQILSVNGQACSSPYMTSAEVAILLRKAVGDVTLVVHNKQGGASDLVECMIMKSHPKAALGISIASKPNRNGSAIHSISGWSKFNNSLLNSGDTLLSVNGTTVAHASSSDVLAELTQQTQKITILARISQEIGVVVAELPPMPLTITETPRRNNNKLKLAIQRLVKRRTRKTFVSRLKKHLKPTST